MMFVLMVQEQNNSSYQTGTQEAYKVLQNAFIFFVAIIIK